MCDSHREAWRWWCDGALLVTRSVIYLESKAHNQHGYQQHSAAIRHPIWFGLSGTIICFSTWTVERRLRDSGLRGQIAAKKPLKDNNKMKRLAWAKKHEQWTLDRWKSVLWSDESKWEIFRSNHRVLVRHREFERIISACVVPSVKHGGGGVMVLCWWHGLWFI